MNISIPALSTGSGPLYPLTTELVNAALSPTFASVSGPIYLGTASLNLGLVSLLVRLKSNILAGRLDRNNYVSVQKMRSSFFVFS